MGADLWHLGLPADAAGGTLREETFRDLLPSDARIEEAKDSLPFKKSTVWFPFLAPLG